MKTNEHIKIITDIENFKDRVDEITSSVSYETIKHAISEIKKALYNNENITALCAPQIGINLRLFVVRKANSEGLHLSREISASIPDKEFIIPRKSKIHVAYQAEMGQVESETYIGAYAEVIQQMIEMLDGITLADYGLDLDDVGGPAAFDKASKKQRTEVLALYLETLKNTSADLAKEIEEDPELNRINSAIDQLTEALNKDFEDSRKEEIKK